MLVRQGPLFRVVSSSSLVFIINCCYHFTVWIFHNFFLHFLTLFRFFNVDIINNSTKLCFPITPLWASPTVSLGQDWIEVQGVCIAMDWIVSPQNSSVEALSLNKLDSETGLVRRWLGVNGVMRVGLWSNRLSDLLRVVTIRSDHCSCQGARHTRSSIYKPTQEP